MSSIQVLKKLKNPLPLIGCDVWLHVLHVGRQNVYSPTSEPQEVEKSGSATLAVTGERYPHFPHTAQSPNEVPNLRVVHDLSFEDSFNFVWDFVLREPFIRREVYRLDPVWRRATDHGII
jgi:hypothetical protein